jgi:hypothetical protein
MPIAKPVTTLATRYYYILVLCAMDEVHRSLTYHCRGNGARLNGATDNADNGTNLKDSDPAHIRGDGSGEQGSKEAPGEEQAIGAGDDGVRPAIVRRGRVGFEVQTRVPGWLAESRNDHGQRVAAKQRAEGCKEDGL